MLRISDISHANTALFLEQAINTAEYYGFTPLNEALTHFKGTSPIGGKRIDSSKMSFVRREERPLVSMIHTCADRGIGSPYTPAFIWKEGQTMRQGSSQYATLELHVMGVPNAIAEALLLAVIDAIAQEAGIERRVVCLNSIGTAESSARYMRDLSTYLRKHLGDLPPALRAKVAKDPFGVLAQLAEKGDPLADRAPASMEYLNEDERRHFWDVLEYLEAARLYYELNPRILGSRDCWSHTLFDVCSIDAEQEKLIPFARGGRYDTLATQCVSPDAAATSITLMCEVQGRSQLKAQKRRSPINVYFAHLGSEAKRRSIPILEMLRHAEIPVHQSLAFDHIGEQMRLAQKLEVGYIIIMGHKEASEGTVIVRETTTNSQEAISVDALPGYLKRRRVVRA